MESIENYKKDIAIFNIIILENKSIKRIYLTLFRIKKSDH